MSFTFDTAAMLLVAGALIKLSREVSAIGVALKGLGESISAEASHRKEGDGALGESLDRERDERRAEDARLESRIIRLEDR
jgi:hypothetical protein